MANILLDTSAIFSLLNVEDSHHRRAAEIHKAILSRKASLVLPNFLLAESHTILNRRMGYQVAKEFLDAALRDFEIERVTLEDEWTAHAILHQTTRRRDLSYFDAVAVAVAERLGIKEIFSFDSHFERSGLTLSQP